MATPRERIFAVARGERPDKVPFNIWDNKVPDDATLRALLEREACLTVKSVAYTTDLEGIRIERESDVSAEGVARLRFTYPKGQGAAKKCLRGVSHSLR